MVHKIKNYKEIKPNNKKINDIKKDEENIYKYKEELKRINEYFNDYINDFIDDLINDLDIYINIYKIIIINSSNNYENIKNILDFKPKELMSDINYFLKEKNKLKNLINLWETKKNKIKKEINIIYKITKNDKNIKLFGKEFVENNKENCYLLINNKKCQICEIYNLDTKENKGNLIIKLIENKNIRDMSSMFDGCSSLLSLPDISKLNTNNVTNMNKILWMFFAKIFA